MLFLVTSTPTPQRPEEFKDIRKTFRDWIREQKMKGKVDMFYAKAARGSVVVFDVASNEELHKLMTQWLDIVPVEFEVAPLIEPEGIR